MKDSTKIILANTTLFFVLIGLMLFLGDQPLLYYSLPSVEFISALLLFAAVNIILLNRFRRDLSVKYRKKYSLPERAMDISPSGIFFIDETGSILDLNLKAESWFFGKKEDIIGDSLFRNIDCSVRTGIKIKTIFFNDLGSHFPAEVQIRALPSGGRPVFAVFVSDLTEFVREKDKLMKLAGEDPLTGLLNRRSFLLELNREIERSARTGLSCTLALIDLDHFKEINDTYGHDFGDEVLRVFSSILRKNSRRLDILCRYGGEEFVVLLPHTDPENSIHFLNRVKKEFAGYYYSNNIQPTFSCGVVKGTLKGDGSDVDRMLKEADNLLYIAKDKGRNRIEAADDRKIGLVRVS